MTVAPPLASASRRRVSKDVRARPLNYDCCRAISSSLILISFSLVTSRNVVSSSILNIQNSPNLLVSLSPSRQQMSDVTMAAPDAQQSLLESLLSEYGLNEAKIAKMGHDIDPESGKEVFGVKHGNRVYRFRVRAHKRVSINSNALVVSCRGSASTNNRC